MHRRVRRIARTICVPDRNGIVGDVVLGFDTIAEYEHDKLYVGVLFGRYANRIAHGRFTMRSGSCRWMKGRFQVFSCSLSQTRHSIFQWRIPPAIVFIITTNSDTMAAATTTATSSIAAVTSRHLRRDCAIRCSFRVQSCDMVRHIGHAQRLALRVLGAHKVDATRLLTDIDARDFPECVEIDDIDRAWL